MIHCFITSFKTRHFSYNNCISATDTVMSFNLPLIIYILNSAPTDSAFFPPYLHMHAYYFVSKLRAKCRAVYAGTITRDYIFDSRSV